MYDISRIVDSGKVATAASRLDTSAFKAYDIRGLYPSQVNEELAYRVGQAFVTLLKAKTIVVGMDMRISSKSLKKQLIKGITDMGATAIDIGMVTTPMVSFAVAYYKYDAGVVVSASHNPGQYNAFKLIKFPAQQIDANSGITDIKKLVTANKFTHARREGRVITDKITKEYVNHVLKSLQHTINLKKKMKVVADYGNGVGAISARPFFDKIAKLGISCVHLYEEPDGSFPNHPANPHDLKNLKDLQERVKKDKADVGFFFDGDADRCFVVDDKGKVIFPDMMIALMAEEELLKYPKSKIYYDLRFSRVTAEKIKEYGGRPIMMRVGNPFYKKKMINEGGALAGELSGHIMFKDNFCIDDGLYAAAKTLELLAMKKKKLSSLVRPLKKYYATEEINMKVANAAATLKYVESRFKGDHIKLDGVLVHFKDWWFSLRMSQTEPLVRLRIEANIKEKRDSMKKKILGLIAQANDREGK